MLIIQVIILSTLAKKAAVSRDIGQKCVNHDKAGPHAMGITAYNTKKGASSPSRAGFTKGKLKGQESRELCLGQNGKVYTVEGGHLADDLRKILCDEGYFSYFPKFDGIFDTARHNSIIFCKLQNPGPMSTHNEQKYCSVLYCNYGDGKMMKEYYDSLPATCKHPLNETVAKEIVKSTWTRRRHK